MLGYAFCGSFCTLKRSCDALESLVREGYEVQPIMSEITYSEDSRFQSAKELRERVERLTGRKIIHTVQDAEPLGPATPMDALIISPCTGNTLSKLAVGVTDTAVTMAAKAHMRSDRPLLIALATNDALSRNLQNIAALINRKNVYFVPMRQDDPIGKPHSLVAEMSLIGECLSMAVSDMQYRPIFLEKGGPV